MISDLSGSKSLKELLPSGPVDGGGRGSDVVVGSSSIRVGPLGGGGVEALVEDGGGGGAGYVASALRCLVRVLNWGRS